MVPGELTNISFIGLSFTLLMGLLLMRLPSRLAILPIFMVASYITLEQRINIFGLNFYLLRILILFGWVRIIFRKEISAININSIDKVIIYWVIYSIFSYTLLHGSLEAFVNRLGFGFNAIGIYFLFRAFIRDFNDVNNSIKILAIIIAPLAVLMLNEFFTGKNLFSFFGGVPEFTILREGKIRCQGSFAHSIMAGTFGATLIPLFFGLYFQGKNRKISIIGIIGAIVITFASTSVGPMISFAAGLLGLLMWFFRKDLRIIRWGFLYILILLHIAMKAPVWYLISRISNLLGGHGWYRSHLINQAIHYFNEWWLIGTKYTAHWFPFAVLESDPNMIDITNQYILEGVNGGLVKLVLFIAIIYLCFRELGLSLRLNENETIEKKLFLWSIGAALFSHVVSFIAVPYFDQMIVFWYFLLAIISTISNLSRSVEDVSKQGSSY